MSEKNLQATFEEVLGGCDMLGKYMFNYQEALRPDLTLEAP